MNQPDIDGGGEWTAVRIDGQDFLVRVPEEVGMIAEVAGAEVDALEAALAEEQPVTEVASRFLDRIAHLRTIHTDESGLFDQALISGIRRLFMSGHIDEAVRVSTNILDSAVTWEAMQELEKMAREAGSPQYVPGSLEWAILDSLDRTDPSRALGVLRVIRTTVLNNQQAGSAQVLDDTDQEIAIRVGPNYDQVADWIETEAPGMPEVDWSLLEAVVRDDSMWPPGREAAFRILAAHDTARTVNMIINAGGIRAGAVKKVKELLAVLPPEVIKTPAGSHLNAMIALAFYRRDEHAAARTVVAALTDAGAVGYLAENLLRHNQNAGAEVTRLLLGIQDRRAMIDIILDSQWPDRTTPDSLLDDLVILRNNRSAGGKGPVPSPYPIEMRAECILALADRREQDGQAQEAVELRERADLLRRQLASGYVKYMPRKTVAKTVR